MAYKVFTNGSVLNASEINDNLMNQSVMVFSNATARAAALTSPTEGMLTWLEDVNRYEFRNGSGAWVPLSSGALDLVKTQTIGTAVTSVTVTDAFSADYENYLIMVNGGVGSTGNRFQLQLGSTNTGYFSAQVLYIYTSGGSFVNGNNNGANFPAAGAYSTNNISVELTLQNPFQSKLTMYRTTTLETSSSGAVFHEAGLLNNTTSYTAFTLICPSGNITGGTISVYGYKKA